MYTLKVIIILLVPFVLNAQGTENKLVFKSMNVTDTVQSVIKKHGEFFFRNDMFGTKKISFATWDNNTILTESDSTIIVVSYEIRQVHGFWLTATHVNLVTGKIMRGIQGNAIKCDSCDWTEHYLSGIASLGSAQKTNYTWLDTRSGLPRIHCYEIILKEDGTGQIWNRITDTKKEFKK